jgi:hypothetical protein
MNSIDKVLGVTGADLARAEPRSMTIAQAIQELGDEVFEALSPQVSEELAVALRELDRPDAELTKSSWENSRKNSQRT